MDKLRWGEVRWNLLLMYVVIGGVIGWLVGRAQLAIPTALGFFIGSLAFELFMRDRVRDQADRRMDRTSGKD